MNFDETAKRIIMEKLAGAGTFLPDASESDGTSMGNALERMKITAVNRSYRDIPAENKLKKITRLFKRLVRRLTFWYVEPCMIQQTDYNTANNTLSAQIMSELEKMDSKNRLLEERMKELENSISVLSESLSFSQSGEDAVISYVLNTLHLDIKNCRYLDLGANHAVHLSNTYKFYRQGARGVLVDANPELAEELRRERPEDTVINRCISENPDCSLDFYILNGDGLSTPDYQSALKRIEENPSLEITKKIEVKSITVGEIIDTCFPDKSPEIMNIDIEGNELSILKTVDFQKFRPLIIICEMIGYRNGLTVGEKNTEIYSFMESVGYREFAFTGINSIFIDGRKE